MKLLFLGELDIHARDFLPFLNKHGYDITVLNTSHWEFPQTIIDTDIRVSNLYEDDNIQPFFKDPLGLLRKSAFYFLSQKIKIAHNKIAQIVKQNKIDIVYGSWGSPNLPELRLVKTLDVPVVYEFLSYPYYTKLPFERIENRLNSGIINNLDGRVFASQRMKAYMESVFDVETGMNLIFPESYSSRVFYKERLSRFSEFDHEPHIIFTGSDVLDVFSQIKEMVNRKIHVHICETTGVKEKFQEIGRGEFIHIFKKFSYPELFNGDFATFMTKFDACLVTYNFGVASTLNRFYNSLPNRFSFALPAGIPIIMPKGYMKGCEELIKKHKIGFAYADYDDLNRKLRTVDLMAYYQRNAVEKSRLFTLESNFDTINAFLEKVSKNHRMNLRL